MTLSNVKIGISLFAFGLILTACGAEEGDKNKQAIGGTPLKCGITGCLS